MKEKITIENKDLHLLSGILEFPAGPTLAYAIFAHCFTCNKDLNAVRNISKALKDKGFAVLTFDFTGLGSSEGDFSETNFSSNVSDLLHAARYLEEHYEAPSVMIGHSLGGTATLFAADQIPSVKAIVTIGSPADPAHVRHLLEKKMEEIETSGSATVIVGGRPFLIKKHFLEDLQTHYLKQILKNLNKGYLIIHSPQDAVVGIENAAALYKAASHPKSFVSIDGADHLLSQKKDSLYVGELISSWAKRYL
jgi:putative redox protein